MAYQSVHSGPAIDAAVTQLADIQIVRDESNANLATVQNLAAQVATDAGTASTAAASATQALNDATAAIAAADHARQEQIDAEIAIVADQRFAAEQAATEAVAAADAAVATVTQDMAASVPTPNKLPLADSEGKIASDWLGADIARAADVVRGDALAAPAGAGLVGFQQAGTGAVARTLQDKGSDIIHAADFGASPSATAATNVAALQAAIDHAALTRGRVILGPGTHDITARVTVRTGVALIGAGKTLTTLRVTTNDRVLVLENDSEVHGLTADANGTHDGTTKLSVVSVGSRCIVSRVVAKNGYTGVSAGDVTAQTSSTFTDITTHNNISRGLALDPFASKNIVRGLHSYSNGNAGFLIGHGSSENIVDGFVIEQINNASIWVHQGSYRNKVSNGIIRNPQLATSVGINVGSHAYENVFSDIDVYGYDRVIQFVGHAVDGVYAGIGDGDTWGNIANNVNGVGNAAVSGYAVSFQNASGAQTARDNVVRNSVYRSFYGIFQNVNDAANGCTISDIKTSGVGAGGVMKAMKSPSGVVKISNVEGFETRIRYMSNTFAVDSAGTKTLVISHGLPYTPPLSALLVTLQRESTVSDFRIDHVWPVASTSTDITARAQVGAASATAGAVQKLSVVLDMQSENGFPLSAIT